MFRGEPIALKMILMGFVYFVITQFLGLFMPGVLFPSPQSIIQAHYSAAFLGWIGLVIFGAQLQFFRAISGVRRYEPLYLRWIYFGGFVIGISLFILGNIMTISILVYIGLIFYFIGAMIHSYWIIPRIKSDLFKFPLNYLIGSHVFFLLTFVIISIKLAIDPFSIANNFDTVHLFSIGWISLSLQGAMIRAGPMFMGQVIDRGYRRHIETHFYFSFFSSLIFSMGFVLDNSFILIIGAILWTISWIWVITLMISSVFFGRREVDYKPTMVFIFTGLFLLGLGAIFGILEQFFGIFETVHRGLHIHTSLLAGLALIMLGVIHRVTSFQIYTILYTGRRESDVRIDDFLKMDLVKYLIPGFIVSPIILIIGFVVNNLAISAFGGIANLVFTVMFGFYLLSNLFHYLSEIDNAIPFWLKKGEIDTDN